jgi:histidinol phosphatase-like PHP family hydrolase
LAEGLFQLSEMDMHLHAGMEREMAMAPWIDLAVKDGRKVLLLLDHLELYRMNRQEHKEWVAKNKVKDWYPCAREGHLALMKDIKQAAKRKDVLVFSGWEVSETELDTVLEAEPMRLAEVIGWHISSNRNGPPPDGKKLLKRTRQIIKAQEQFHVPMIIFHPFSMRIENILRRAQQTGRDPATITTAEYRFFQPGEQQELIGLLRDRSIYIEIPRGLTGYWQNPLIRQAFIEDIHPLAEAGVQFIVSTDAHGVRSYQKPFNPRSYCDDLAVTTENTNTIIRELLAIRAKTALRLRAN